MSGSIRVWGRYISLLAPEYLLIRGCLCLQMAEKEPEWLQRKRGKAAGCLTCTWSGPKKSASPRASHQGRTDDTGICGQRPS